MARLNKVLEAIKESIEDQGGSFKILEKVCFDSFKLNLSIPVLILHPCKITASKNLRHKSLLFTIRAFRLPCIGS